MRHGNVLLLGVVTLLYQGDSILCTFSVLATTQPAATDPRTTHSEGTRACNRWFNLGRIVSPLAGDDTSDCFEKNKGTREAQTTQINHYIYKCWNVVSILHLRIQLSRSFLGIMIEQDFICTLGKCYWRNLVSSILARRTKLVVDVELVMDCFEKSTHRLMKAIGLIPCFVSCLTHCFKRWNLF